MTLAAGSGLRHRAPAATTVAMASVGVGAPVVAAAMVVYRPVLMLAVPLAAIWAAILTRWRVGVYALLVWLPLSGLPIFLVESKYAPVIKDVLLVLPLYAAFAGYCARNRLPLLPRRDALVATGLAFAGVVIAYVALSPTLLTGLIGLKVWVFYLPLFAVGYHFAQRREDIERFVTVTVAVALVPATVAVAEVYFFVRGGDFGPFMRLYGRFHEVIVAQVGFGATIPRIPATFTSSAGYYNFAIVAFACAFGLWAYRRRGILAAAAIFFALAAVASGIRRSYVTIPLLALLALLVSRAGVATKVRVALAAAAGVVLLGALDVEVGAVASQFQAGAPATVADTINREFVPALARGTIGEGTGANTNAAFRYADYTASEVWRESWYTKALVELGYVGFVLAVMLVLLVLRRTYAGVVRSDASLRPLLAPLWAALAVTALTLVKAPELDWDPMNAYFWLAAGILVGAPSAIPSRQAE